VPETTTRRRWEFAQGHSDTAAGVHIEQYADGSWSVEVHAFGRFLGWYR
jgi:hypothetical protein